MLVVFVTLSSMNVCLAVGGEIDPYRLKYIAGVERDLESQTVLRGEMDPLYVMYDMYV